MHNITTSCESFNFLSLPTGMRETEVVLHFLPLDANPRDFQTFCQVKIFRDLVPNLVKQLQDSVIHGRPMPVCLLLPEDGLNDEGERIQAALARLGKFNQFLRTCYEGVGLGFLLDEKFIVHGAQYLELESERKRIQDKDLCAVWRVIRRTLLENANVTARDLQASNTETDRKVLNTLQASQLCLPEPMASAEKIRTFLNDNRHFAWFDGIKHLDFKKRGLLSIPLELRCFRNTTGFSVLDNCIVEMPKFLYLPSVQAIAARKNKMKRMPTTYLPNMTHLFLLENKITNAVFSCDAFPILETCNLNRNPITTVVKTANPSPLHTLRLTCPYSCDLSALSQLPNLITLTVNQIGTSGHTEIDFFLQQWNLPKDPEQ